MLADNPFKTLGTLFGFICLIHLSQQDEDFVFLPPKKGHEKEFRIVQTSRPNPVVRVGESISLACRSSHPWNLCSWQQPGGAWCDRLSAASKFTTSCQNNPRVKYDKPKIKTVYDLEHSREVQSDCSITIIDASPSDDGIWRCRLKEDVHQNNTDETTLSLSVASPFQISIIPPQTQGVPTLSLLNKTHEVEFICVANGSGNVRPKVQWIIDGRTADKNVLKSWTETHSSGYELIHLALILNADYLSQFNLDSLTNETVHQLGLRCVSKQLYPNGSVIFQSSLATKAIVILRDQVQEIPVANSEMNVAGLTISILIVLVTLVAIVLICWAKKNTKWCFANEDLRSRAVNRSNEGSRNDVRSHEEAVQFLDGGRHTHIEERQTIIPNGDRHVNRPEMLNPNASSSLNNLDLVTIETDARQRSENPSDAVTERSQTADVRHSTPLSENPNLQRPQQPVPQTQLGQQSQPVAQPQLRQQPLPELGGHQPQPELVPQSQHFSKKTPEKEDSNILPKTPDTEESSFELLVQTEVDPEPSKSAPMAHAESLDHDQILDTPEIDMNGNSFLATSQLVDVTNAATGPPSVLGLDNTDTTMGSPVPIAESSLFDHDTLGSLLTPPPTERPPSPPSDDSGPETPSAPPEELGPQLFAPISPASPASPNEIPPPIVPRSEVQHVQVGRLRSLPLPPAHSLPPPPPPPSNNSMIVEADIETQSPTRTKSQPPMQGRVDPNRLLELISAPPPSLDVHDREVTGASSALPPYTSRASTQASGLSDGLVLPRKPNVRRQNEYVTIIPRSTSLQGPIPNNQVPRSQSTFTFRSPSEAIPESNSAGTSPRRPISETAL